MKYVLALLPSAGVLFLFWLAVRAMLQADRRERAAHARMVRDTASPTPSPAPSPEASPTPSPVKGSGTQGTHVTPNG